MEVSASILIKTQSVGNQEEIHNEDDQCTTSNGCNDYDQFI